MENYLDKMLSGIFIMDRDMVIVDDFAKDVLNERIQYLIKERNFPSHYPFHIIFAIFKKELINLVETELNKHESKKSFLIEALNRTSNKIKEMCAEDSQIEKLSFEYRQKKKDGLLSDDDKFKNNFEIVFEEDNHDLD